MKQFAWILVFCSAAAQAAIADQPPAPPATKPVAEAPPGIEASADGKRRVRDAQGRTWIYRKSPFGAAWLEEERPQPEPAKMPPPSCRVVRLEKEEAVFERRSPFSHATWTKRLDQLDEMERRALEEWKKARQ